MNDLTVSNANVARIESQLFNVVAKPLVVLEDHFFNPNSFGIYKENGGLPLGVVGKDFMASQPKDLFKALVPCLVDANLSLDKLTYQTFKDDAKISFRTPIKMIGFKNLRGEMDESMLYLNLQTGFDGYTKSSMYLTMMRMVCTNGMKAINTEFSVSFKNTKGNAHNISMLCNDVAKSVNQVETIEAMILRLNSVKFDKKSKALFLTKVLGYDVNEPKEKMHAIRLASLEQIESAIAIEVARTGDTLWGLVNGISYFTNHLNTAKNQADYLYQGGGNLLNMKAQKVALEMAK